MNGQSKKVLTVMLALALVLAALRSPAQETPSRPEAQRIVQQGLALEFSAAPAGATADTWPVLQEREPATVTFKVTDSATGTALARLRPAAWIHPQTTSKIAEGKDCRAIVQSFLTASLGARPAVDLNTYYVLALNEDASISVIDPLLAFGTSKLLTFVRLKSPGHDWVLSQDGKRLYVALPLSNQIGVIDTTTWKVLTYVDAGFRPSRLALQRDGKYLWVTVDGAGGAPAEGGVAVIDTGALTVAARIRTGAGPHTLALSADDRTVFVANEGAGTLSVIDITTLATIKTLQVGKRPVGVAFSAVSQAAYVANTAEGTITVIDGKRHEILAQLTAQPGLSALRFAPGGRLGFAVNTAHDVVHIFDAATNRVIHTVDVGKTPDQVTFTEDFAYVRSRGTELVTMIPLTGLDRGRPASVASFSGGQSAPGTVPLSAAGDAIFPAPEGGAVLVANVADGTIYYYKEGMAAPMGSFRNYRRQPRAVLVADRSLREAAPGIYSTTVNLPAAGEYQVAMLVDSPRLVHCFDLTVAPAATAGRNKKPALAIEPVFSERTIPVGETVRLSFRVTDKSANEPKTDLRDLGVLATAPGGWQSRASAEAKGEGIYEVALTVPNPGVYYVFFQAPSLGLRFNQLPGLTLKATTGKPAADEAAKP